MLITRLFIVYKHWKQKTIINLSYTTIIHKQVWKTKSSQKLIYCSHRDNSETLHFWYIYNSKETLLLVQGRAKCTHFSKASRVLTVAFCLRQVAAVEWGGSPCHQGIQQAAGERIGVGAPSAVKFGAEIGKQRRYIIYGKEFSKFHLQSFNTWLR